MPTEVIVAVVGAFGAVTGGLVIAVKRLVRCVQDIQKSNQTFLENHLGKIVQALCDGTDAARALKDETEAMRGELRDTVRETIRTCKGPKE